MIPIFDTLIRVHFSKKVYFFVALLLIMFCGIFEVILPKIIADVLECGVAQADFTVIYEMIIKMMVISGLIAVFSYFASALLAVAKSDFENNLRLGIFKKYQTSCEMEVTSGKSVTMLTADVDKVSDIVIFAVELVFKPFVMTVLSFIMIFFIDKYVGLCFLFFFLMQIVLINYFSKRLQHGFEKVQSVIDKINSHIQEVLENIKFVKISCSQKYESDKFDEMNEKRYDEKVYILKKISYFNPLVAFFMNLALALTVVFLGIKNSWSGAEVGSVIMLISYAEQIVTAIVSSGRGIQQFSEYKASYGRLKEILFKEEPADKTYGTGKISQVTFDDVTCVDSNGGTLFENLNFTIKTGDRIAVIGSTGCGKTLFSGLFSGSSKPDSGKVIINDNNEMAKFSRDKVAYAGEGNGIFSLSIYDNISLGRDNLSLEEVEKIVDVVRLNDFVDSRKYKLKTMLTSDGSTVSGGERQRIALARALAGKPDVLVIDNSTSSVDYLSETEILQNITEYMPELMIVFITQRNNSLKNVVEKLNFKEQKVFAVG